MDVPTFWFHQKQISSLRTMYAHVILAFLAHCINTLKYTLQIEPG